MACLSPTISDAQASATNRLMFLDPPGLCLGGLQLLTLSRKVVALDDLYEHVGDTDLPVLRFAPNRVQHRALKTQ